MSMLHVSKIAPGKSTVLKIMVGAGGCATSKTG